MSRLLLPTALLAVSTAVLPAQERAIPKDSALVTLQGCARDRLFIVGRRSEHQPGTLEIQPGRRFRLAGSKALLDDLKRRQRMMVEVTGLVRRADVAGPGGVSILGGRVRLGGRMPQDPIANPASDPAYYQPVLDVEAWRPLADPCPDR